MSDTSDPPATDAAVATANRHVRAGDLVVVAGELALVLGVVVGFNQLATQSPVDAILPVALFSVGVAGVLALVSALVGLRPSASARPDPLVAPSLDSGVASFTIGLAALAAVGWRWGVTTQATVVGVQSLRLLIGAEAGIVAVVRRHPERPDPYRLALTAAEGAALLVFAVAALADAGIRPFT